MSRAVRNIAIIAHVDHGKTTLVDKLLVQAGSFSAHQHITERMMDSNDLEKERGITILAKNLAVDYAGVHINIVDTPGHADFGGEVERVLSMVDGVLLLVDAVEGPMPQTRFVTKKALALGLKPIVVVNKIDRDGARPDWVVDHTFDLFDKLGANDDQLDFPVIYASAINGYATLDLSKPSPDMRPMFETILKHVSPPHADEIDGPLQLQISALDYSSYVGRIGIGRLQRGRLKPAQQVIVMYGQADAQGRFEHGAPKTAKVGQVFGFRGLERVPLDEAVAGDIVLVTGIDDLSIGCTITDTEKPEALPMLRIDEPTLNMTFMVNNSPYAGTEGKFVTSRQIGERLRKELLTNMALRVEETTDTDSFLVSGRGELHLTILLETMRREGYELAVGRPKVIVKEIDGEACEPYEMLTLDVEEVASGRRHGSARLSPWRPAGHVFRWARPRPSRISHPGTRPDRFPGRVPQPDARHRPDEPRFRRVCVVKGDIPGRRNGVLISAEKGEAVAYALWKLQDRGRMFTVPGDKLYEGMVIGIHSRENDLVVNPIKGKQLTNVRASGTDEAVRLVPPVALTLESAVEFIDDDELVEITPKSIRIRKRLLTDNERRRAARELSLRG
jgi:GTP-binding protein